MKTDAEIDVFLNSLDNLSSSDIKQFVEELRTPATEQVAEVQDDFYYLHVAEELVYQEMVNIKETLTMNRAEMIVKCANCIANIENIRRQWEVYSVE